MGFKIDTNMIILEDYPEKKLIIILPESSIVSFTDSVFNLFQITLGILNI